MRGCVEGGSWSDAMKLWFRETEYWQTASGEGGLLKDATQKTEDEKSLRVKFP